MAFVATVGFQEGKLCLGLDTLGNDSQIEVLGHGDDGQRGGGVVREVKSVSRPGAPGWRGLRGDVVFEESP